MAHPHSNPHPQYIDLTGQRFGRLIVVRREGSTRHRQPLWLCVCDCGNEVTVGGQNLRTGITKSCGCIRIEHPNRITHGMHGTPEYQAWQNMKVRCYWPGYHAYKDYGGRGITVCDRWLHSFANFLEDMGLKPSPSQSLDRTDVDGPYSPTNCRCATKLEQTHNRRKPSS